MITESAVVKKSGACFGWTAEIDYSQPSAMGYDLWLIAKRRPKKKPRRTKDMQKK